MPNKFLTKTLKKKKNCNRKSEKKKKIVTKQAQKKAQLRCVAIRRWYSVSKPIEVETWWKEGEVETW